jgi:hypothetical protein
MKLIALTLATAFLMASGYADETQGSESESSLTPEQIEALLERAMEEAAAQDDDCDNTRLTSCIGFDRNNCEAFSAEIISECTLPMAREILSSDGEGTENLEFEHAKCTLILAEDKYRIAPERYLDCMPPGTYQDPGRIKDWLKNRQ